MALLLEVPREGGEGGRHGLSGHQEIRNVRTQTLSVPSSVCWLITAPRKVMLRAGSGRCESYLHSVNIPTGTWFLLPPCFTTVATEFREEELF